MVVVFNDIFGATDVLFDVLQKKSFDINFCISQVKNTQTLIHSKRTDDAFLKIFDLAASKTTVYHEWHKRITLTQDQLFEK